MSARALPPFSVRASSEAPLETPRALTSNVLSLDSPIVRLSRKGDYLTGRDLVTNVAIKGSIGKGKSSGPYELLLRACVESGHFGMILCAKTDTAQRAIEIIRKSERKSKIVHITPTSGHYFNPIEFAMSQGGKFFPMDEALDELWTMLEIINRGEVSQQGDNFFVPAQRELTHKAMKLIHAAKGKVELRDLMAICERLPESYGALDNPERYFVLKMIEAARKKFPAGCDEQLDRAISYFANQLPGLSDKTRSSIQISATVRLSALLEPIYDMFFKHPSNITPRDIIDEEMWVVVDVPYALYRSASRAIGAAWKQALQKELMRRPYNEDRFLCGIWQDECACWLTEKMDVEAAERGRASGMYHVNTYQAHSTIVNGYGGGAVGEARANALLSNFNVHIMCGQTDAATRLNDQKMIGNVPTLVKTITQNWKDDDGAGNRGGGGHGESHTAQWLPSLPEEWLLGLEHGQHGYVEAFIFVGGRKFKWNEKRWLLVRWPQNYEGWKWWEAVTEKAPVARGWWLYVPPRWVWDEFMRFKGTGPGEFRRWWRFWVEDQGRYRWEEF